jgi:hypothetical protein
MTARWIVVCSLAAACTGQMNDSCPADQPSSCPSPQPSYATDIAPLIQHYCATASCHSASGSANGWDFTSYSGIKTFALDAEHQLYQCRMPLYPAPAPTTAERVTLLTWFECGAPNN